MHSCLSRCVVFSKMLTLKFIILVHLSVGLPNRSFVRLSLLRLRPRFTTSKHEVLRLDICSHSRFFLAHTYYKVSFVYRDDS